MRGRAHTEADGEVETTRRALHRDLRGLELLEAAQRILAVGLLVGIALRGILESEHVSVKVLLSVALLLALTHLTMAFRIRRGAELVRRELWLVEARQSSESARSASFTAAAHPYRSRPEELDRPTTRRSRVDRSWGRRIAAYSAFAALASGLTLVSACGHLVVGAPSDVRSGATRFPTSLPVDLDADSGQREG